MEDSFYDIGYEGTSLEDCLAVRKLGTRNVIVFDKNDGYGTTFASLDSLKNCNYVRNLKVNKQVGNIKVEAIPYIFKPDDEKLTDLIASGIENFVDFIPIHNHYFILNSGKYYKIPYSKTELVDLKYCNFKERHLLNKLLKKEISLKDLKKQLSEKTKRILFNGIIGDVEEYEKAIYKYLSNFGNIPFLYPKHGLKDLSEMLSRSSAMSGVSFLLNKSLKIYNLQPNEVKTIKYGKEYSNDADMNNKDDYKQIRSNINPDIHKNIEENVFLSENIESEDISKKTIKNSLECIDECKCENEYDSLHIKGFDDTSSNYDDGIDEEVSEDDLYNDENDHTGKLFIKQYVSCLCNKSKENYLSINRDSNFLKTNGENKKHGNDERTDFMKACNLPENMGIPIENLNIKKLSEEDFKIILKNEITFNATDDYDIEKNDPKNDKSYVSLSAYLEEKIQDGYRYLIRSDYGNVFVKELIKSKQSKRRIFVRLINTSEKLIERRFFAFLHNGKSFIRVIVIDSATNSCPDGTYNIYLIKKDFPVSNDDVSILKIHHCKISLDISYETYGEWCDYLT